MAINKKFTVTRANIWDVLKYVLKVLRLKSKITTRNVYTGSFEQAEELLEKYKDITMFVEEENKTILSVCATHHVGDKPALIEGNKTGREWVAVRTLCVSGYGILTYPGDQIHITDNRILILKTMEKNLDGPTTPHVTAIAW